MSRSLLLRAVYDGFLTLGLDFGGPVRLQQYTDADTHVIVLGDLGGQLHPDDIPETVLRHDVQIAVYHPSPATALAQAQTIYETFAAFSVGTGGDHPWTLPGWTVAQVQIAPPRVWGVGPSDPHRRTRVTLDLRLVCAVMTPIA